jgi:hypothetical protein
MRRRNPPDRHTQVQQLVLIAAAVPALLIAGH